MVNEVHQVVSADGAFDETFEDYVRSNGLHESGADYQIIAITGPQSSGKSTLMNKLVRRYRATVESSTRILLKCKCDSART